MSKKLVMMAVAALVLASAPQVTQAKSSAPLGYQLMCLKTPAECRGGGTSSVKASDDVMATIRKVNASVNRSIAPRDDSGADRWSASAAAGDCEEYVLAKRRALIRAGFSPSALRIAYVTTSWGEGHAILVVKTSKGDVVMDNLDGTVRPLSRSGYRMVSMSGANPMQWN